MENKRNKYVQVILLLLSLSVLIFIVSNIVVHQESGSVYNKIQNCEKNRSNCSAQRLSCPYNWIHFKNRCYYFSTVQRTWYEAKEVCDTSFDVDLIDIDFIFFETNGTAHWVAIYKHGIGGSRYIYRTVSGINITNVEVGGGERISKSEDCVYVGKHTWKSNLLFDGDCIKKRNFVCVKRAVYF